MKPVLLLIACFALAINADDTVKDDVKTWIKDFKDAVNAIGKGGAVKDHINPVTLAELEVFGQLCKPSGEKIDSSSSEQKRTKRDAKTSQLEKACVALYKKWPEAQAKFDALSKESKDAWDKYMNELATEFQLLKLEILVRWEIYVSDAKCGCDKFKIKLPKLKLKLGKKWKKFVASAKAKYEDLSKKAGDKWDELKIKFGKLHARIEAEWGAFEAECKANWEGFKANWDGFKLNVNAKWEGFKVDVKIGWGQLEADFDKFKVSFHAKMHDLKLAAKARWEKIKIKIKAAAEGFVNGAKKVGHKIEDGAKAVGKGIGKFFGKIKGGVEHIFSSSSSSSSESKSCELDTYISNIKGAKVEIHTLFNQKQ